VKAVTVLGGGFAGLSAAIHLALAGCEVTLLEQNTTFGGKARQLEKDGFRFDTGPSVFTLPHIIEEIFERAGESLPFDLKPLNLLCRYHYPSGRVWDVYSDAERTTEQLSAKEADVYRNLLAEARKLYEAAAPTFGFGQSPTRLELLRYGLKHGLAAHPFRTLEGLLDSYGATGDLKQFFLRFATYFGADPYRAPAVLHNIAWAELGLGVSYPTGGIYAVVKGLVGLAEKVGVDLRPDVKIEQLEHSARRVKTVHTSQGSFHADAVVSALDIIRTHKLLHLETRLERLEPSLSGFVMLLGIEGETSELRHHSISFSSDYRSEFAAIRRGEFPTDPTLYFNISSKTDPDDAPPGCENWFVMANAPALDERPLDEERYLEHLLGVLAKRGFDISKKLRFAEIIGPSKLAQLAHRGSIYGVAPHSLLQTLRPKQTLNGFDNLVLAGGSVFPGGGIPLALLSGKAAAELVIKADKSKRQ